MLVLVKWMLPLTGERRKNSTYQVAPVNCLVASLLICYLGSCEHLTCAVVFYIVMYGKRRVHLQ